MEFIPLKEDSRRLSSYQESINPLNYPVGCHTYENFYTEKEINEIEKNIEDTEN